MLAKRISIPDCQLCLLAHPSPDLQSALDQAAVYRWSRTLEELNLRLDVLVEAACLSLENDVHAQRQYTFGSLLAHL